jgi:3-hydroxy-3-methylglutaryl CoA synthase
VGICSYGSGSCAEIFGGIICPSARDTVRRHRIGEHLAERIDVDMPQYERLVLEGERALVMPNYTPSRNSVPDLFAQRYENRERLGLRCVEQHYRQYDWCAS